MQDKKVFGFMYMFEIGLFFIFSMLFYEEVELFNDMYKFGGVTYCIMITILDISFLINEWQNIQHRIFCGLNMILLLISFLIMLGNFVSNISISIMAFLGYFFLMLLESFIPDCFRNVKCKVNSSGARCK